MSFGSLWRGQKTNPNSCGIDSTKLRICGININSNVLLKWPKIPTTAKTIPAKYVYVSPTNTSEGYLLYLKRAREPAIKGRIKEREKM